MIIGNDAANHLLGAGGQDSLTGNGGADILEGGDGSDIYYFDAGDTIVEAAGAAAGKDLVITSLSYTLGANLEDLYLTGTDAITGTGNGLDNVIVGNDSANNINGGDGNDILDGALGGDDNHGGAALDTNS